MHFHISIIYILPLLASAAPSPFGSGVQKRQTPEHPEELGPQNEVEIDDLTFDLRPDFHVVADHPDLVQGQISPTWFHSCGGVADVLCTDIQTQTNATGEWTWRSQGGGECQIGAYTTQEQKDLKTIPNPQDCKNLMVRMVERFAKNLAANDGTITEYNRVRWNVMKTPTSLWNVGLLNDPLKPGFIIQA